MTSVAISTEPSVVQPVRAPGRVGAVLGDTVGFLGTWLRLVWRHWPALLALALAGTLARELLLSATNAASAWRGGLGGLLAFPLVPCALLIAMVLMLRVVRPSLPYLGRRDRPEPMLVYLASVLIPFLAFYFLAGYADYDRSRYAYSIAVARAFNGERDKDMLTRGAIVLVLAGAAFCLRWILIRVRAVARRPWLAIPALYLEVFWIYTAFLVIDNDFRPRGADWLAHTRVGHATLTWWHAEINLARPISATLGAGRTVIDSFRDGLSPAFLAPLAALVAGSVVLAARIAPRTGDAGSRSRVRRLVRVGAATARPIGGRFELIANGVRRVLQAGVVATLLFCLCYTGLYAVGPLLNEPERVLIGPRDVRRVWELLYFPLQWVNNAIGLVLIMCLVAAFVDRTAARIARRAGGSTPLPTSGTPAPATLASASTVAVPQQPTARFAPPAPAVGSTGPAWAGPSVGGGAFRPARPGGFTPVTPVYTTPTPGHTPPGFGSAFDTSAGLAPPAAGPPPQPSGLTGGLWGERQPDVAGKPVGPDEAQGGWRSFRRK